MQKVNILWTGGWDSTFRVLQLSSKKVIIQPYYLRDNRKSENIEIETIKNITFQIRNLSNTNCIIKDLITINVLDLEKDETIDLSYFNINQKFNETYNKNLGIQYEWLAKFAKIIENLELCVEKDTKPIVAIENFGKMKKIGDNIKGEYYIVDPINSSRELLDIFGGFHYPLKDFSKETMKNIALENGYINIMNQTWFCHNPISNKPCGVCNPCMATIEEGFHYRFPKKSLIRYNVKKFINPIKGTIPYRLINKVFKHI